MKRIVRAWLAGLVVGLLASPALAANAFEGWSVVGDDELAQLRGGIDTGAGSLISFGIERLTFLNGELQTRTSLDLAPGPLDGNALGTLVRFSNLSNGPGGLPSFLSSFQNDLDGQKLQGLTLINASVNTMGAFRSLQTGISLERALTSVVH